MIQNAIDSIKINCSNDSYQRLILKYLNQIESKN